MAVWEGPTSAIVFQKRLFSDDGLSLHLPCGAFLYEESPGWTGETLAMRLYRWRLNTTLYLSNCIPRALSCLA